MLNIWPHIPWLRWRPELPEEAPSSLRIAPETEPGAWPGPLGLAVPDYPPDANADAVLDGTIRPADGGGNPFGFGNAQHLPADPFVRDRGLLLPRSTPLLFPHAAESGLLGLGLGSLVGEPQPDLYASNFRMDASGLGPDGTDAAPPVGNPSADAILPASAVHSETSPVYDPAYFPQPPEKQAQQPLGQIVRTGFESNPANTFDWLNFALRPAPVDGRVAGDAFPGISKTFDPQFIVPVNRPPPPTPRAPQAPQRQSPPPERGPKDNNPPGPPPDKLPPGSSTIPPQSVPGGLAPRPPSATEPPLNAAGPAAAAEQRLDAPRPVHPLPRMAEALGKIVKARHEEVPSSQYEGADGRETAIGVRINPRLPEPAAGLDYNPTQHHLRNGYKGEVELANRIVAALEDEIVVHYGMRAGRHGPDVVSVSPNGDITVWDSKWRTWPRSIGDGAAGHQRPGSLAIAMGAVQEQIDHAVKSGRMSPEVGQKASLNVQKGNFFVNTIGTGNAHGGVVRCVRFRQFADCWE